MKKISLIILAFIILGCNPKHSNKTENKEFIPPPCVRHYPNDNPVAWEKICANAPYINGERISQETKNLLVEVSFFCSGHLSPSAKEVNEVCKMNLFLEEQHQRQPQKIDI